ncbi:MAG: hypothetical protein M3Z04_04695 [Chloroflexota bacterium]|nr:hypothetical protein [Chloroflexota bacterium]
MLKWLFPLVLITDIVLVWAQVLDTRTALIVGGTLEVLAFLLGLRAVGAALLAYRRNRAAGLHMEAALEDGLTILFPRKIARLVAMEPRIYVCLYRFLRRSPPAADEFAYYRRSMMGAVVALIFLTAPFEVLAYELLIPWAGVRWALLALTLYSMLWLLGFYASLRTLPYRLAADGLQLHYGLVAEGTVPYAALADATLERRKAPQGREGLQTSRDGALYLAIGGRTDLTLRLHTPVIIQGLFQPQPPATVLHLAADDPAALVAALRARAGLPLTEPPGPVRAVGRGPWAVAPEV